MKFNREPGDFSEPAERLDLDRAGRGALGDARAVDAEAGLAPEICECRALSKSLKRCVPVDGVPLACGPLGVKAACPSGAGLRSSSRLRTAGLGEETRGAEPPQGIGLRCPARDENAKQPERLAAGEGSFGALEPGDSENEEPWRTI